jgi:hypothetical protein
MAKGKKTKAENERTKLLQSKLDSRYKYLSKSYKVFFTVVR